MKLVRGNIWSHLEDDDVLVFPANGSLTKNRTSNKTTLITGASSANAVAERFPTIREDLGRVIESVFVKQAEISVVNRPIFHIYQYGAVSSPNQYVYCGKRVYVFALQTKTFFKYNSDLGLVEWSLTCLKDLMLENNVDPTRIKMIMPGVGLGRLNFNDVAAVLDKVDLGDITVFHL